MNAHKSSILFNGLEDNLERQLSQILHYSPTPFDNGFNVWGFNFYMKPNDYKFKNWLWWFEKIEGR